jgi:hypothetical protein
LDFGFWILDFDDGDQSKIQNLKSKIATADNIAFHAVERAAGFLKMPDGAKRETIEGMKRKRRYSPAAASCSGM